MHFLKISILASTSTSCMITTKEELHLFQEIIKLASNLPLSGFHAEVAGAEFSLSISYGVASNELSML